ncbi:N-acetylmuramoyl-L-alanine amidase [Pseudoponticoccus marisrubri]|uniref:Uncharacterized protein n=1 Tax=Pseudoponticoccus marisrubri TaxID=1685382 RepID=A0A0W7WFT1_9RHOB|nr:N-acetylmuramoyl-L-alanine amidase [Pseudoponticoccus marisrubri]KUF09466.1 hypothetical protein AVJ23_17650 [Pseudoponticoccus marisrubri]
MPALIRLCLLLLAGATTLSAEPAPLSIEGEIVPALSGIEQATLDTYRHARITHITFHHEGFAGTDADLFARASAARARQSIAQRVRNIHHDHAHNAGLGMIAYHYAVDPAGQIAKGRPVRYKPATRSTLRGSSRRADFDGHFAVVALGDFNHQHLTEAARASYVRVMSEAQRAYRVPTANILPHLHHAQTSCPGTHIMDEIDSLLRRVTTRSLQAELVARGCGTPALSGTWDAPSAAAFERLVAAHGAMLASHAPGDAVLQQMLHDPALACD